MINLDTETLLSLSEAAGRLPPFRQGRPVTSSCVLRWILSGIRCPIGNRIQLDGTRCGGRWLTSVEAMQRFADAQTPRLNGEGKAPPRPPVTRTKAADRAGRRLAALGI